MPYKKAPSSGGFLPALLMYLCSGQPMHFCSGVDTRPGQAPGVRREYPFGASSHGFLQFLFLQDSHLASLPHSAFIVIAVLMILRDCRHGFDLKAALGSLDTRCK